jgi:hypothetical protein
MWQLCNIALAIGIDREDSSLQLEETQAQFTAFSSGWICDL